MTNIQTPVYLCKIHLNKGMLIYFAYLQNSVLWIKSNLAENLM